MADQKQTEKDALNAGGDTSAAKQQNQAETLQSTETKRADFGGKMVTRERAETERASLSSVTPTALTVVEDDVYEQFYVDNVRRPLYRRLLSRGQVIATDEYERLMAGKLAVADTDVALQVSGAEGAVGATVEPQGPAKAVSSGRRS